LLKDHIEYPSLVITISVADILWSVDIVDLNELDHKKLLPVLMMDEITNVLSVDSETMLVVDVVPL